MRGSLEYNGSRMPDDPAASTPKSSGRPIYLDNHATTRVDARVLAEMLPFFEERFGNAASINHRFGWQAADAVDRARGEIAGLIGAPPQSLIFTSGGTEANNLALKGVMRRAPHGSHVAVAEAEHRSVLDPARRLARHEYALSLVPVTNCARVEPQAVASALRPQTVLVSIMLANNEVGTINPIGEIAEICHARGVLVHCDAVQAIGRIPVSVHELGADLVSLSAHKLYGPKGVGALYIRPSDRPIRLEPLLDGGGHERHLRSGTLPVPLIVGFGTACRLAHENLAEESKQIAALRDQLWRGLSERISGLTLNGDPHARLPGNLNVSFEGIDGESLMRSLTEIAVSSGSACTTAEPEPSHVLRAMGVSDSLSRASLRFGLGRFTTCEEIDFAIAYVAETVARLRA